MERSTLYQASVESPYDCSKRVVVDLIGGQSGRDAVQDGIAFGIDCIMAFGGCSTTLAIHLQAVRDIEDYIWR
jgi:hypothetical protein